MKNIAFFSITVMEESNSGIPVRIVFNFCNSSRDVELVTLKVNHSVKALMTPTPVAAGNNTPVVPSLRIVLVGGQGFFWL